MSHHDEPPPEPVEIVAPLDDECFLCVKSAEATLVFRGQSEKAVSLCYDDLNDTKLAAMSWMQNYWKAREERWNPQPSAYMNATRGSTATVEERYWVPITKEQFAIYETVRQSGKFNMWDPQAEAATGLGKDVYIACIKNYSMLAKTWPSVINLRRVDPHVRPVQRGPSTEELKGHLRFLWDEVLNYLDNCHCSSTVEEAQEEQCATCFFYQSMKQAGVNATGDEYDERLRKALMIFKEVIADE